MIFLLSKLKSLQKVCLDFLVTVQIALLTGKSRHTCYTDLRFDEKKIWTHLRKSRWTEIVGGFRPENRKYRVATKCESHNVESQNVKEPNVEFTKCRITKCRNHMMSNLENVEFTKCRRHKMSNSQNFELTKCRIFSNVKFL